MILVDDDKIHHAVTITHPTHSNVSLSHPDEVVTPESGSDDTGYDHPDGGSVAWRQVVAGHFINAGMTFALSAHALSLWQYSAFPYHQAETSFDWQ